MSFQTRSQGGVSIQNKKQTTLKTEGDMDLYDETYDVVFQWYPYLFLNRSKPETHLAAFSRIPEDTIVRDAPAELTALIKRMSGMFFDFKRCGNLVP